MGVPCPAVLSLSAINGTRNRPLSHDGDTVTVVEGGSVSGTMRELASTMRFSREQKQYNNYLIPALTRLTGVSITGAEG